MKTSLFVLLCWSLIQGIAFAGEGRFRNQIEQIETGGKVQKELPCSFSDAVKRRRFPRLEKKKRKCKGKRGRTGATGATGATGGSYGQYISAISTSIDFFCDDPIAFTSMYAQGGIQFNNQTTFVIQQNGVYSITVWFDSTDPDETAYLQTTGVYSNSIEVGSMIPLTVDLDLAAGDEVILRGINMTLSIENPSGRSAYIEIHRIH